VILALGHDHTTKQPDSILLPSALSFSMDELSASGETLGLSSQWRSRSRPGSTILGWWGRKHPTWLMLASLTRTEINVPGGSQKGMFRIIE
jgi:hypothetical protein